jgi:hypothetical protein
MKRKTPPDEGGVKKSGSFLSVTQSFSREAACAKTSRENRREPLLARARRFHLPDALAGALVAGLIDGRSMCGTRAQRARDFTLTRLICALDHTSVRSPMRSR